MITFKVPKLTENGNVPLTRNQLNGSCETHKKVCYVCREKRDKSDFGSNVSRADGLQTSCKFCAKEKQSKWYYKRVHGITLEARDELLKKQNMRCAICGNETDFQFKSGKHTNTGEFAVVDHCHSSEKIRGILCGHCNTGLGAFKDDPFTLHKAIDYLLNSVE